MDPETGKLLQTIFTDSGRKRIRKLFIAETKIWIFLVVIHCILAGANIMREAFIGFAPELNGYWLTQYFYTYFITQIVVFLAHDGIVLIRGTKLGLKKFEGILSSAIVVGLYALLAAFEVVWFILAWVQFYTVFPTLSQTGQLMHIFSWIICCATIVLYGWTAFYYYQNSKQIADSTAIPKALEGESEENFKRRLAETDEEREKRVAEFGESIRDRDPQKKFWGKFKSLEEGKKFDQLKKIQNYLIPLVVGASIIELVILYLIPVFGSHEETIYLNPINKFWFIGYSVGFVSITLMIGTMMDMFRKNLYGTQFEEMGQGKLTYGVLNYVALGGLIATCGYLITYVIISWVMYDSSLSTANSKRMQQSMFGLGIFGAVLVPVIIVMVAIYSSRVLGLSKFVSVLRKTEEELEEKGEDE
jgi:hypothetical protein